MVMMNIVKTTLKSNIYNKLRSLNTIIIPVYDVAHTIGISPETVAQSMGQTRHVRWSCWTWKMYDEMVVSIHLNTSVDYNVGELLTPSIFPNWVTFSLTTNP